MIMDEEQNPVRRKINPYSGIFDGHTIEYPQYLIAMERDLLKEKEVDRNQEQQVVISSYLNKGTKRNFNSDEDDKYIVAKNARTTSPNYSPDEIDGHQNSYKTKVSDVTFAQSPESDTTLPLEDPQENELQMIDIETPEGQNSVVQSEGPLTVAGLSRGALDPSNVNSKSGDFAFVDSGLEPSPTSNRILLRVSTSTSTSSVPEVPPKELLLNSECEADSSTASSNRETILPDQVSFTPSVISTKYDCRKERSLQLSTMESYVGADSSEKLTTCLEHAVTFLPEVMKKNYVPNSSVSSSKLSCEKSTPDQLPSAFRDREEYIPLDASSDYLDQQEREVRQRALRIKELVESNTTDSKRLAQEREHLKSKMAELKADLSVRKTVIEQSNQTLANNNDKIAQWEEECKQQEDIANQAYTKLMETELTLRQLQVDICQEKLKAEKDKTWETVRLTIDEKEGRIAMLKENIKQYIEEDRKSKEALIMLKNCLKEGTEKGQTQRQRIDEIKTEQRKAEALLTENKGKFREATVAMHRLHAEKKVSSADFVNLEEMLVKIRMCQKLQHLARKKKEIIGRDAAILKRTSPENVQYARQINSFSLSSNLLPSSMMVPAASTLLDVENHP